MKTLTERQCFGCSTALTSKVIFQVCSRCKGAEYCSHPCQKRDYTHHKDTCRKLGCLLTAFEADYLCNEATKRFLTKEDFTLQLWNEMESTLENVQDHVVQLVRSLQPIIGSYIDMGHRKRSVYPIENALKWLLKGLKVVVYHTEHLNKEENKNCLRFGGEWDENKENLRKMKPKKDCCDSKKEGFPEAFGCQAMAKRMAQLENSPSGCADPFFCFGGKQNIPEVFILMGKYQEAADYIHHWTDKRFWRRRTLAKGEIVQHLKEWHNGKYVKVNFYIDIDIKWDLFDGDEESKVLLRLYGVLILIRLHATTNLSNMKKERLQQFQAFLLGTHVRVGEDSPVSTLADDQIPLKLIRKYIIHDDPRESARANRKYIYYLLNAHIRLSANCMYFMTGDARFQSRMSMMGLSCQDDPNVEIHRLVWHLFQMLSEEEVVLLCEAYRKISNEFNQMSL